MNSNLIPLTSYLGIPVRSEANEAIGKIEDIFLDAGGMDIAYLLISIQIPSLEEERSYLIHNMFFNLSRSERYVQISSSIQYSLLDRLPPFFPNIHKGKKLRSYGDFKRQIVPLIANAGHRSDY